MKNALSLILCMLMLASCLAIGAVAAEEPTEAPAATQATEADGTTAPEEPVFSPTHIVFDKNLTGKKNIADSTNGMSGVLISKSGEWNGMKFEITDPSDPHVQINYGKYLSKFENDPVNIENYPFIVIKVLTDDIAFDDFEIYYCAGDVTSPTEDCRAESTDALENGEGAYFFVFDLTGLAQGALHTLRIDVLGADIGALMYVTDLVLFADKEEALQWCGYYDEKPEESEQESTEEVTTEATTEQVTEAPTTEQKTEAQTQAKEEGCGGVIGAGLVTLSLISLGAVCIKKKDE